MSTTWTIEEKPAGCNYEVLANGTARTGEAVEFGYVAELKSGDYAPPDTVVVTLAESAGDTTSAVTQAGTVTSDTSTSTYTVTATMPTTKTENLAGIYVYETEEKRGTNETIAFGGGFTFLDRVGG